LLQPLLSAAGCHTRPGKFKFKKKAQKPSEDINSRLFFMNKKGLMVNLQESAMFLAGISCKHIAFVLNVCCIPAIRKSTTFFKYFPISISSVSFQVHYFNPILHMYGANADQRIVYFLVV
jgi:hypothetical protein